MYYTAYVGLGWEQCVSLFILAYRNISVNKISIFDDSYKIILWFVQWMLIEFVSIQAMKKIPILVCVSHCIDNFIVGCTHFILQYWIPWIESMTTPYDKNIF